MFQEMAQYQSLELGHLMGYLGIQKVKTLWGGLVSLPRGGVGLAPRLPKLTVSSCGTRPWRPGVESDYETNRCYLLCVFGNQTTSISVMSHLVHKEPALASELGQVPQEKGQVGQVVLRPLKEQHDHIVAGKPPLFVVGGFGSQTTTNVVVVGEPNHNNEK